MNLISKPSKENLKSYLPVGITLFSLSLVDVFVNAFFNYNLLGFFPGQISYFSPLILGFIGLYLIRMEIPKTIVQVMALAGFLLKFGLIGSCMAFIQILNNGE